MKDMLQYIEDVLAFYQRKDFTDIFVLLLIMCDHMRNRKKRKKVRKRDTEKQKLISFLKMLK